MWIQAGEYREKPKDKPSLARIKAMLNQCRLRGLAGCNCEDECKVEKVLEEERRGQQPA